MRDDTKRIPESVTSGAIRIKSRMGLRGEARGCIGLQGRGEWSGAGRVAGRGCRQVGASKKKEEGPKTLLLSGTARRPGRAAFRTAWH